LQRAPQISAFLSTNMHERQYAMGLEPLLELSDPRRANVRLHSLDTLAEPFCSTGYEGASVA
jgi:hypothetical protein